MKKENHFRGFIAVVSLFAFLLSFAPRGVSAVEKYSCSGTDQLVQWNKFVQVDMLVPEQYVFPEMVFTYAPVPVKKTTKAIRNNFVYFPKLC